MESPAHNGRHRAASCEGDEEVLFGLVEVVEVDAELGFGVEADLILGEYVPCRACSRSLRRGCRRPRVVLCCRRAWCRGVTRDFGREAAGVVALLAGAPAE